MVHYQNKMLVASLVEKDQIVPQSGHGKKQTNKKNKQKRKRYTKPDSKCLFARFCLNY